MSCPRRLSQIVSALAILAGIQLAAADDIYRTLDAQGNVTYSDRAISPASRKVTVDVVAPNPENAARLAKEQAVISASEANQDKSEKSDQAAWQRLQAEAAARKYRCDAARSRYAAFAAGGRIWKADSQGNRVYYSDQEIESERVLSKTAMDSACTQ